MAVAFVLINTDPEALEDALKSLKTIDGVREAYGIYGVYDTIAKVEGEDTERLKDTVTWRIRKLRNVRLTQTMIVMERW